MDPAYAAVGVLGLWIVLSPIVARAIGVQPDDPAQDPDACPARPQWPPASDPVIGRDQVRDERRAQLHARGWR